ncbi:nucleoside phosphorylase [Pricia sp. S334]|uniref:Uridine phosphorylase n=1 Tax=Pricia mediterranea TaxID=3076079 RepID=A0ABU3LA09_9FLAO|nr:nucleoside phosphorylase [Pricia sp. S334]MDT7830576.1 nucleoside phosphorylase [Pricia sp. S334]
MLGTSELILNPDGSIYHLNLLPEDLADTVITVGDPDRVSEVSSFFETVEIKKGKREFRTHTGILNGKRLSVVSTGIGTDNIDIVLNELDALVNIDFKSRTLHSKKKKLDIVRIGTSGAIQPDIPLDSFLMSEYAIGLDGLLHFYHSTAVQYTEMAEAFAAHTGWSSKKAEPYAVECDAVIAKKLLSNRIRLGITLTNTGFYGPQGRKLRLQTHNDRFMEGLKDFKFAELKITNMEMETSGIYGLSKLLGHRAVSMNCILANRSTGEFSANPKKATRDLIGYCLEKICG